MDFSVFRQEMVENDLKPRGIDDPRVLQSFMEVPREEFVPVELREKAYADYPLPIGQGQTISQPYVVALMTQAANLKSTDKVLEIGTGSGYQAAILSRLVKEVYSVERLPELAELALVRFKNLGLKNIFVRVGDGSLGWQEEAPFKAILVTAAASSVPRSLLDQLSISGRLVIPVETGLGWQDLKVITKISKDKIRKESLGPVVFVPLVT